MAFAGRFVIWGTMDRIFNALVDVRQIQTRKSPADNRRAFEFLKERSSR
jgi:hypothetical protein